MARYGDNRKTNWSSCYPNPPQNSPDIKRLGRVIRAKGKQRPKQQANDDSMSEIEEFLSLTNKNPKPSLKDKAGANALATRVYKANGVTEEARNVMRRYNKTVESNSEQQCQPKGSSKDLSS